MAFLEQRGDRFRIIFRHAGRRYIRTLKTKDPAIAEGFKGAIERTLMLLDQRVLKVPDGVDVLSFVIGYGQVEEEKPQPNGEDGRRLEGEVVGLTLSLGPLAPLPEAEGAG